MNIYNVSVLPDGGDRPPTNYKIIATTDEDAIMIAFCLDGGWMENDATEILELAKMYCGATLIETIH